MKRGAWVGGLVGPVSDGHTQVWGWVWWPAATRRSHHAAAAPFWGLRCPRGGWVRGGGRRDRDVWDGGPGPWVPPQEEWASCPEGRRPVTVLGVSKHRAAPRPAGRPGVGFLQPRHRTPDGGRGWDRGRFLSGLEPEVKVLGARSSAGSGVSRSQATPSPVSVSAVTSPSPPCVWVQMSPMRTPCTQVNLGSSAVAHLHTKSQSEVPGSPSSGGRCERRGDLQGRNPGASRRKRCPDSGRTDGQAEAGGRPRGRSPLSSGG